MHARALLESDPHRRVVSEIYPKRVDFLMKVKCELYDKGIRHAAESHIPAAGHIM